MSFKPAGWSTVSPRLIVTDVAGLVSFLRIVFGAEGVLQQSSPTELRIGESTVMVSDGGGLRDAVSAFLYVYVDDADETYRRAIIHGAVTIEAPIDMSYGDRRANVRDTWGNLWQIATRKP